MSVEKVDQMNSILPLILAESALLIWVLVALPIYAGLKSRKDPSPPQLKGLALPQGSGPVDAGIDDCRIVCGVSRLWRLTPLGIRRALPRLWPR